MKRLLLILTLCLTVITTKADSYNCPTDIGYNSTTKEFTFYYAGGIPVDGNGQATYTRIELEISKGKGAGHTWFVNVLSKTSNTIITDNSGDNLDSSSEMISTQKIDGSWSTKDKLTYFNGSKDLNTYSNSDARWVGHCYNNGPLPVTLKYLKYNGSVFTWCTGSEINCLGFHLQSSEDTRIWTEEAFIYSKAVAGFSNSDINYNFNLWSKVPYWRLVQEDFNGTKEIFPVIHNLFIEKNIRVFDLMGSEVFNYDSLHGIYVVLESNKWSKKLYNYIQCN